jgi:hypothetical protein
MSVEQNEALVRRHIDLCNLHDLGAVYDTVSADCIFHMVAGDLDVSKGGSTMKHSPLDSWIWFTKSSSSSRKATRSLAA